MADHMANSQSRTGVAIREPLPWHDLVQLVQTAEQTGYEALFVPEGLGREAFATLAGLAPVTERILLAPGVAAITARPARTAAMAAATVQELSGGRLILGLGAGFERKIAAVRAYVNEVRQTELGFDAGHPPSVWLAALGDRMIALAAEVADGVLLNWCTPERLQRARATLDDAVQRGGRDPGAVTLATYIRACVEPDEAVAIQAIAPQAQQYASIPHYRAHFEQMGLAEEAAAAASGEGPGPLIRAVTLVGDAKAAADRLQAYRDAGADLPVVYPVPALEPLSSMLGTVLALAPHPTLEA
jgi:alkanesulfonate monooxygenase SsuD/methylene tetrahydromethanopterin reductase-like flavin-dependent oxidoreductase (luciferase family)